MITQLWSRPATIERNNFKHKSLSCWSYNIAVGCAHKCRFCYVPEVSTNRMAPKLATVGVTDPDAQWGDYVFPRQWDRNAFLASLRAAEATPADELNADGNRAVMLCTTTDPYQTLNSPTLNTQLELLVREALGLLLTHSTLRVRILTRSPLARRDFDLMKLFGERLMFGMSLPTLNNQLARIYEPNAPAPTQRLATLQAAKAAGIPVFVAVAPVYPECDMEDMRATLKAVKELHPQTIFMEPINIRAENVARIKDHAKSLGESVNTEVFKSPENWRSYAVQQLVEFESMAHELGIGDGVLHLWPDQSLGSHAALKQFGKASIVRWEISTNQPAWPLYGDWLQSHWNKISAWPTI